MSMNRGMHPAPRLPDREEWRMRLTRSGNRLSLLAKVARGSKLAKSACGAAIVLGIIVIALAAGATTAAQSSSAPAVRVLRDFRLYQRVWPADLDRDGVTDLISSSATTFTGGTASGENLQVSTGKGDGTFNAPVQSSFRGFVLGAADFNGDQLVDVIAASYPTPDGSSFVLLRGTGTATLGAPVIIARVPDPFFAFALSADFSGDGKRDLVVPGGDGIRIYPGNGDFTFGTPAALTDQNVPIEGIAADFNGDGRRDLAIVNMFSSLSIFLNQGSLLFSAADISMPAGPSGERGVTDATVRDVNGDGRIDLLVSAGRAEEIFFGPGAGFVFVLPGNGDGTFGTPVEYPVAMGPRQIVAGDFNRDGVTDIVTGNQSSIARDDCAAPSRKTWDSVSILVGQGNGTFAGPWNFSIGDQSRSDPADPDDDRYRNTLTSLNTSDLNGDRSTDLIASHGAVLLNIAATPNQAPVVNAGPDTVLYNTRETVLRPMASDPDNDMLTWQLRDETGAGTSNYPNYCYQQLHIGDNTITVTVDDGHGHRVSDTVVYTVVSTEPPTVVVDAPTFGEVVAAAPYTVRWSAAAGGSPLARFDVFSAADDQFQWQAIAECTALPATARQCVWQQPGPPSNRSRVKVTATDEAGRSSDGVSPPFTVLDSSGNTIPSGWSHGDVGNVATAGSANFDGSIWTVTGSGADIWGTADEFHFAYRQLPTEFEIQTRVDTVQNVHAWTKAGLMVRTSVHPSAPQASIFVTPGKGIAFQRRRSHGAVSISTQGPALTAPVWLRLTGFRGVIRGYYKKNLTDRWTLLGQDTLSNYTTANVGLAVTSHADGTLARATFSNLRGGQIPEWVGARAIGSTTARADYDGTDYALTSRGPDIWGVGDAFAYLWTSTAAVAESTIIARVYSVDNTHAWAKAGVMFRESLDPGSKHVFAMVTPGKGLSLQYRPETSGQSVSAATVAGIAPRWLKLQRSGNTFTASYSTDGMTFVQFGTATVLMAETATVGLATTSHNNSVEGTARYDNVQLIQPGFLSQ
jgi:regulation of enolase protein 1 (concanavalin A-like superfamily)